MSIVDRWETVEEAVVVESVAQPKHDPNQFGQLAAQIGVLALVLLTLLFGGKNYAALGVAKLILWGGLLTALVWPSFRERFTSRLDASSRDSFTWLGLRICAGVILLGFVQVAPLPFFLLKNLSPGAAEIYRLVGASYGRLSLDWMNTASDIAWAVTVIAFAALLLCLPSKVVQTQVSLQRKRSRQRHVMMDQAREIDLTSDRLQRALVFVGFFTAVIGLSHWVLGSTELFGVFAHEYGSSYANRVHWPLINPNHFSLIMQVSGLTAAARMLRLSQLWQLRKSPEGEHVFSLRNLRYPERYSKHLLYLGIIFVIVVANVLTFSRAGNALMFCGLALQWLAFRRFPARSALRAVKRPTYRSGTVSTLIAFFHRFRGLLIACLALLFVSSFVGQSARDLAYRRLEYGLTYRADGMRYDFARASMEVFLSYPIAGVGLGNWRLAAAKVVPKELAGWKLDYAHNDLFQFVSEAGLFGIFLLGWVLRETGSRIKRIWRLSLTPTERFQIFSSLVAVTVPLLHSLVDFPLHIPAVLLAMVIAFVVALRLSAFVAPFRSE